MVSNPCMAIYYHLPKGHRNIENPPGHLVISGTDSLTSNLSEYIDLQLQKYAINLPSYLGD